jgi:hypothetical protein
VFSVFDSLTVASNGLANAQVQVQSTDLGSLRYERLASVVADQTTNSPLIAASITSSRSPNLRPAGLVPLPPAGVRITLASIGFMSRHPAAPAAKRAVNDSTPYEEVVVVHRTGHDNGSVAFATKLRISVVPDSVLDEPAFDDELRAARRGLRVVPETIGDSALASAAFADLVIAPGPMLRQSAAPHARLTDIVLAAGFCSFGAGTLAARSRKVRGVSCAREVPGSRLWTT